VILCNEIHYIWEVVRDKPIIYSHAVNLRFQFIFARETMVFLATHE
jgi:hypothetical protein